MDDEYRALLEDEHLRNLKRLEILTCPGYTGHRRYAIFHPDTALPLIVAAPTALAAHIRAAEHLGYRVSDPAFMDWTGSQKL